MRPRYNTRGFLATHSALATLAAALVLCLVPAEHTRAAILGQPGIPSPAEPAPSASGLELARALASTQAAVPTPAEAMAAFRVVDAWVRELAVPAAVENPSALVPCRGVAIVLRYDRRVVGRGQAFTLEPAGRRDLYEAAAREAISEALRRLPGSRDATWPEQSRLLAQDLAISVELAGDLTPIAMQEWRDALASVEPGVQGVAIRVEGSETAEAIFPASMLVSQTEPPAAAAALAARVLSDPQATLGKTPAQLTKAHGLVFYRFNTAHLAQLKPGDTPLFLHRGQKIVRSADLTREALQTWRQQLAAHLRRAWVGADAGAPLAGAIDPLRPGAPESPASPQQAALVVAALAADPGDAASRAVALEIVRTLARDDAALGGPSRDPLAASLIVWGCAQAAIQDPQWRTALAAGGFWDRCVATVQAAGVNGVADAVSPAARGPLAAALAMLASGESRESVVAARGAVQRVLADTPPSQLVGHMPWLGLADVRVAFLERAARQDGASDAGIVYRAMREEMWRRLATPESLSPAKADLAGSIWFGPDGGISPIATSIQSRPVVFVAAMLGDLEMTPSAEAGIETARLLAALRYLRQLTVDDASAWMYPDPARAMGGVRTSVWDQRLAPEATAMTLLAVHETLRTFDLLERRSR